MVYALLFLFIVLLLLYLVLDKCLKIVVKPHVWSFEESRKEEEKHGFSASLEAYDKEWKRLPFTLDRGDAILSCEWIENPENENRVAIIAHGHTVNRCPSIKYAAIFYKLGFDAVLYDERSFGLSTGKICTLGEKESEDLAALIDYVRKERGEDCFIALHGESMGAATVLQVLDRREVGLVAADCPFSDTKQLFREWLYAKAKLPSFPLLNLCSYLAKVKYGYHMERVSPIKVVEESEVPICFLHGTSDSLIKADHSRQMYSVCRNPKSRLLLFEGSDHAFSYPDHKVEYEEKLSTFIKSCLSS